MKRSEFKYLKPHIQNVGKILKYIENKAEDVATSSLRKEPGGILTGAGDTPSSPGAFDTLSSSLSSLSSQVKLPSLPRDVMSFKAPKFGSKKAGSETSASSAPSSSRGIGGFKGPSLKGFGRKDSGGLSSTESPKGDEIPAAFASSKPPPSPPTTPKSINDEADRLEHERLRVLNAQVLSYIRSIDTVDPTSDNPVAFEQAPKLPNELKNVLADIPDRKFSRLRTEPDDVETMISPNPILVKSSGIEGLFDIQRVIVTMPQSVKLRRK